MLRRHGHVGSVCTGVKQGDPLSTLFFAVAIQAALDEIDEDIMSLHPGSTPREQWHPRTIVIRVPNGRACMSMMVHIIDGAIPCNTAIPLTKIVINIAIGPYHLVPCGMPYHGMGHTMVPIINGTRVLEYPAGHTKPNIAIFTLAYQKYRNIAILDILHQLYWCIDIGHPLFNMPYHGTRVLPIPRLSTTIFKLALCQFLVLTVCTT
jgi:hypothetical protein